MTPVSDLTDNEFAELDELLAQTPEPLHALDSVMLDGYLCGVLVQPVLLTPEQWFPPIFDDEVRPLPADIDPIWRARLESLTLRRHAALNRAIAEFGWFDPLVLDMDDVPEEEQDEQDAAWKALSQSSRALMPWVAGFQHAMVSFRDLEDIQDDAVYLALARLCRHLPAETPEERDLVAEMDKELPLANLDEAVEDLVAAVVEINDYTSKQRFAVETIKRDAPKVGRNDPCPCGSGRKYKQCHGAT